jgi:hypothetical protein
MCYIGVRLGNSRREHFSYPIHAARVSDWGWSISSLGSNDGSADPLLGSQTQGQPDLALFFTFDDMIQTIDKNASFLSADGITLQYCNSLRQASRRDNENNYSMLSYDPRSAEGDVWNISATICRYEGIRDSEGGANNASPHHSHGINAGLI